MNSKWSLKKENIAKEILRFDLYLSFSSNGNQKLMKTKKIHPGVRVIGSYFMPYKTFDNLLMLVSGFLGYEESILKTSDNDELISALYCNQSSIEGFFNASEQC